MNNKLIIATLFSLIMSIYCAAMLRTSSPDYGACTEITRRGALGAIEGPKASGKSFEILRIIEVLTQHQKQKVLVYQPEDNTLNEDSHDPDLIETRSLLKGIKSRRFKNSSQIINFVHEETEELPNYCVIDNAHLAGNDLIPTVSQLRDLGINVIVSGRGTNYHGEAFGVMPTFLTRGAVTKLKAVCAGCNQWNATLTQCLVNGEPLRPHDDLDILRKTNPDLTFEPRCDNCFGMPKSSLQITRPLFEPGKLFVINGPMCSGKSLELLRIINILTEYAHFNVLICQPTKNTRDQGFIKSKILAAGAEARLFKDASEIMDFLKEDATNGHPDKYLIIDEAQFVDEGLIPVIDKVLSMGIHVIAAGLPTEFAGRPFGIMPILLSKADEDIKLTAVCAVCLRWNATKTQRLKKGSPVPIDAPIVSVQGAVSDESYEPRCSACHKVLPPANQTEPKRS